ncbi:RNA polymerase sigma factor [Kitasatospora sp. NPDC058263]
MDQKPSADAPVDGAPSEFPDFVASRGRQLLRTAFLLTGGDAHLAEDLVQEALGELSAPDRAVLVLRFWEDRSIEETAAALRLSSTAVRSRSSRALARLRDRLGDDFAAVRPGPGEPGSTTEKARVRHAS